MRRNLEGNARESQTSGCDARAGSHASADITEGIVDAEKSRRKRKRNWKSSKENNMGIRDIKESVS